MDFEFQNIDSLNVLCTKKIFSKKIRFKNAFFLVRLMFYARKKNFQNPKIKNFNFMDFGPFECQNID
jgi:hypothetical protein